MRGQRRRFDAEEEFTLDIVVKLKNLVNLTRSRSEECGEVERVLSRAVVSLIKSSVHTGLHHHGSSACLARSLCHGLTLYYTKSSSSLVPNSNSSNSTVCHSV